MIAYVYLAGLLILFLLRLMIGVLVDSIGRSNAFGLRNAIARERGIGAYQAWLPLERIRPTHIPQQQWEEQFAWPPGNKPPYRPFAQRLLLGIASYAVLLLMIGILLEVFAPSVLGWLGELAKMAVG
jgi:hypothetical protein